MGGDNSSEGARPISSISFPRNMPAFPKTLVLRASSPCCPPPAHTGEGRRGDLCHGNPISSPYWTPRLPWLPSRGRVLGDCEGCWCFCRTDTMFSFCCLNLIHEGCTDRVPRPRIALCVCICMYLRALVFDLIPLALLYLGLSGIDSHGWLWEEMWHSEIAKRRRSRKHIHT